MAVTPNVLAAAAGVAHLAKTKRLHFRPLGISQKRRKGMRPLAAFLLPVADAHPELAERFSLPS